MKLARSLTLALASLLVLVILIGVAVSLWFGLSADAPIVARAAEPAPEQVAAGELRIPDGVVAPQEEARTVIEERAVANVPAPVVVEVAGTTLVVSGTVVVHEPDGTEHSDVDGTMELLLWIGNSGTHLAVDIADGRWRGELVEEPAGGFGQHPAGVGAARIGARAPKLTDGRGSVVLVDDKQRFGFGDEEVVVHVRRVTAISVVVEDAQTGVGLDDVTILRITDWRNDDHRHPGGAERVAIVEGVASPVEFRPEQDLAARGGVKCLVGSPGYAWALIELDFGGGERRVRLERGGALEVFVYGDRSQSGAVLRLRTSEREQPYTSHSIEGDAPIRFEGLAASDYVARVEVGDWWDSPLVLANGTATVAVGGVERVTLTLDAAPELTKAPLSGFVILPAEWELDNFWVSLELMDTPLDGSDGRHNLSSRSLKKVDANDDSYAFDLGEVQVGKYEITLGQLEFGMVFELGPAGRSDVTLAVPPPVEVSLLVRDEATGNAADVDSILWNCKRPPGVSGGGLERVEREPGADRFRLRVPRTEVTVRLSGGEYLHATETFEARDGLEVILDVRRAAAAIVKLRDGGTAIPWPDDIGFETAKAVGGPGRMSTRGRRDEGLWFTVTEPGRYRIEIPEIQGFEPHQPVEAELVEGETREVLVDLVRLP